MCKIKGANDRMCACMWKLVADWSGCLACNADTMNSRVTQCSYWGGASSKFFTHNDCCVSSMFCPMVVCTSELCKDGNTAILLSCIQKLTCLYVHLCLCISSLPLSGTWRSSFTTSYPLLSTSLRWLALASTTCASFGWSLALFPLLLLPP